MLLQQEQQLPENGAIVPQGDERRLVVRFYMRPEQNATKTAAAGRPMFDEHLFVQIRQPGVRGDVTDRRANDADIARFPAAYERYKRNVAQPASGTPLEQWPLLTVSEVAELKAMNILSVEVLAELPDSVADKFMGLRTYRKQAQAYLQAANDAAATSRLASELEKRDEKIAMLVEQVETLSRRLETALRDGGGNQRAAGRTE